MISAVVTRSIMFGPGMTLFSQCYQRKSNREARAASGKLATYPIFYFVDLEKGDASVVSPTRDSLDP